MERSRKNVAITGGLYGVKGELTRFFFFWTMGDYRIYLILMGLFQLSGRGCKEEKGKVDFKNP